MWDVIDTDFGGDETANFGPRKETGTALYQIDTIATVSCRDQQNLNIPLVSSSVLGDLTSLAVHSSLVLQSSSLLGFDHGIEVIEWSPDGSLIIVGVSAGILYVIDAESTEIVFSVTLVPEERRIDGKSFKQISFSGTADLVILTADGQVIVQSGIEIFKEKGADLQDVKEKIKFFDTCPQHSITHDIVLFGNHIFTLGGGNSILGKWNYSGSTIELEDEGESMLDNDAELLHGKLTTDGHYLFALDSNNHLSVWDIQMFVCLRQWIDMNVSDFCLLETNTSQNNSLQDMKLVVLTVPVDGVCDLKVQSLPSWETVYNLQLNAPSMLAKCNTFQDALYLTEFCANEQYPGTVSTVRFRCLNETDPKTRLYRILQKNKFEEAEKFANLFQLDIELVHKVKANYLINQLSPWNVGRYSDDEVSEMKNQLWKCLDTIVDDLHTAESCIRAAMPSLTATQALLSYCKSRLDKALVDISSKDPTIKDKHQVLMTKLLETQHRLITFKMAYGEQNYSGEKWEQFMRADLLQESLSWMERGHLDTGFIIWTRHQAEWTAESQLTRDVIQKILSTISYDAPPTSLQGHLSVGLIPTVVREVPEALDLVVNFVIEKTKTMELVDKKNWPSTAVRFAHYVYNRLRELTEVVIDENTCMAQDSANKTRLQYEVVLQPLYTLIVKLQQLDDILHKYKCRLSLAQFLQETTETIAFRMLDKVVALELIMPTLERQIRPYMQEHGLNQDKIFSKYIKDLLERSSQIRSYTSESSWEAKAVAIIGFITDLEQKIEGILEVIKWAPIPWSKGINELIQEGLKLKHPRVSKLKEQCDRVHVRKLMMKYGLKNVEVPQGADAERLMYIMLTQDKPGCMEDAVEVMKSCGVKIKTSLYTFRLRQLIATDRIEEGVELLRSLPTDLGIKAAAELLTYAIIKLDYTVDIGPIHEKINHDKRLFTEAAVHIARYLQVHIQDPLEIQDLKLKESILSSLLALQVEYDMYLRTDQYQDEEHKTAVIYSYMKDFFMKRKQCPTLSYAKVYRLADVLQIPHTTIQGQLAIKSASDGDIQKAVEICGELYESEPTEETAATLFEVAQSFLYLQATVDPDDVDVGKLRLLPELCYRLASQATSICSPEKLCDYLELSKTCSLLLSASQQCESGDSTLSSEWGEWSMDCNYSWDKAQEIFGDVSLDVFQEDALLMNSGVVLPLVAQYGSVNPLIDGPDDAEDKSEDDVNQIQSLCNHVLPVVQHLRENSHLQLAYVFSVHMLDTLTQYIQQQDMGLPIWSEELASKLEHDKKQVQGLQQTSQSLLKELVSAVVMKIFNCSKIDVHLALTFLSTRPKKEVLDNMMKLTKAAGYQYKRLKYVAVMGIALGQLLREPTLIDNFQLLETNASWGYRLSKMKISFQDVLFGPASSKRKILPLIAQSEAADCELVKEFCQSFSLDEDEGLLLYLDHLFVPPDDGIFVSKSNKSSVLGKAKTAIEEIRNKDELLTRLKKLYYRTSSYDYETLGFILEVMQKLDDTEDIPLEKGLKLLEYLKVYTRHSDPSEYEMEYKPGGDKKELQIVMSCLPPESKTRLPIHPLLQGDTWKIITPELKRETIATWLLIAKLLCLSHDQICLTSVQNMVRLYSETFLTPDGGSDMSQWNWSPELANRTLLEEASEVLHLVKNCESSLACAKWMVTKLPMGSEKVLVLKECIKLAELWHQSIPEESAKREKAKAAYLKFLSHWQKMASAQALCQHGLGEAELLQMTDKPSALIQRLYEHPSITDTVCDAAQNKPGIHAAAEAVASINKIDLVSLQNGLVQKWLQSSNSQQPDSDTTMTFNLENLKFTEADTVMDKDDDEEQNFKRVIHLVKRGKIEEKLILLIEYAFKPSENQDMLGSIRALRCLLHLYDDETLKQQCNKSMEDLRHLMHIMIYLVSLEKLHIKHSVQTFVTCQKEGLVRGIWKNHSHEKTAVTLVSCLCLDYNLYDKQLWTSILQRLHQFGLMKQLEYVLRRLSTVPELWSVASFSKMWQTVIMAPLNKVCCPLSSEQTDLCVHYFNLLISCPVLKDMDLDGLSKSYLRLELRSCAIGCLLMAVSPDKEKVKMLLQGKIGCVLENTSALLPHGLNHGIAVKVQESVYNFILETEAFNEVLDTPHQPAFVSHCVKHKSIDSLLQFAITHQRVKEARALFELFIGTYTDIGLKLNDYIDDNDEDDEAGAQLAMLKAYLRMQKLGDYVKLL